MSDELTCMNPACGHTDEEHDEITGLCLVPKCRCVCFRSEDEWEEDDEVDELDFSDHDERDSAA